jgi:hypothetical protein
MDPHEWTSRAWPFFNRSKAFDPLNAILILPRYPDARDGSFRLMKSFGIVLFSEAFAGV